MHPNPARLTLVLLSLSFANAWAQPVPQLLKNINTTTPAGLKPESFCTLGGTTYFVGETPEHGYELWKTNGTAAGTVMVKDIRPGPHSSRPQGLTASDSRVFFNADDGTHGRELWVTDGTEAGTRLVGDLSPGPASSHPSSLRAYEGGVVYVADVGLLGTNLCRSTGNANGTTILKGLHAGGGTAKDYDDWNWMAVVGKTLFMSIYEEEFGVFNLWQSNGTAAGTKKVKGPAPDFSVPDPEDFTVIGNTVFFSAYHPKFGHELWKAGSSGAATVVKDIFPGSFGSTPLNLIAVDGVLYFVAEDDSGLGLWRSTGTAAGTKKLPVDFGGHVPDAMAAAGKAWFFSFASNSPQAGELWKVAAAGKNPELVRKVDPALSGVHIRSITGAGNRVFFEVHSNTEGSELWTSDGTFAGTFKPRELLPGPGSGFGGDIGVAGNAVFFSGNDGTTGSELWTSDGTALGTKRVLDAVPGDDGSNAGAFMTAGGLAYFMADDGVHGRELWRTDGTESGTRMLKDFGPNSPATSTALLGELEGKLIFRRVLDGGIRLWSSDGTEEGTELMDDVRFTPSHAILSWLTVMGSQAFYSYNTLLWRADGMNAAQQLGSATFVSHLTVMNGVVYYSGRSTSLGQELWRSDGTLGGTYLLKDLRPGSGSSSPQSLTVLNGHLYFVALNAAGQQVVWRSDGSAQGTVEITTPALSSLSISAADDTLYAGGWSSSRMFWEFWAMREDGSKERLLEHPSGISSFLARHMGTQFFAFGEAGGRLALWRSQGRSWNTHPVPGGMLGYDVTNTRATVLGGNLITSLLRPQVGLEPHLLPLEPAWSVVVLDDADVETPLANGGTLTFPRQMAGGSRTLRLLLRNTGHAAMTGLAAEITGDAGFALEDLPETVLAAGAEMELEVNFAATAPGGHEATLEITSDVPGLAPLVLTLQGQAVPAGAPEIVRGPRPVLALSGQAVTYDADYFGAEPLTTTWLLGSQTLTSNAQFTLAEVTPAYAGQYTLRVQNAAGTATSTPAPMAVINPAQPRVDVKAGGTLVLVCGVTFPKGAALSYQWLYQGVPLPNVPRYAGARTPTLKVTGFTESDAGDYECLVTLSAQGHEQTLSHGVTEVRLALPPVIVPMIYFDDWPTGMWVEGQVLAANNPTRFTATGLPRGVVINQATGLISGRPEQVLLDKDGNFRPHEVRITAHNNGGSSEPHVIYWTIYPIVYPARYDGLLLETQQLDGGHNLGGRLLFTANRASSLTGQLHFEGKVYRFTQGKHLTSDDGVRLIEVKRGGTLPPLYIEILNSSEITLKDAQGNTALGTIYPCPFGSRAPALRKSGPHVWAFKQLQEPPDPALPLGHGFMTAVVTRNGDVKWKGRLADGTAVTGSSLLGGWTTDEWSGHDVALYASLHKGQDSILGWLFTNGTPDASTPMSYNGMLHWQKLPQPEASRDRAYKTGFRRHALLFNGEKHLPPQRDEAPLLLPDEPGNAILRIQGGGLASEIARSLRLTSGITGAGKKHGVVLSPVWEGLPGMSLRLDVKNGVFSGSLTFTDFNPLAPSKNLTRIAGFQGVLLPSSQTGAGNFILPQLPTAGPPATSASTSPILSGGILIEGDGSPTWAGMSLVPGGSFQMGDTLAEGAADELPLRQVSLLPFLIQKKEVTLTEWNAVVSWAKRNGYSFDSPASAGAVNHPVTGVSWHDAVKWCNARSEMEGLLPCYHTGPVFSTAAVYRAGTFDPALAHVNWSASGYRLPTEAEWERAARGGQAGQRFPLGAALSHDVANYHATPAPGGMDESATAGRHPVFGARGSPFTAPAGSFPGNGYDLHDMTGNAAEWCWDWHAPYAPDALNNPRGPDKPATDAQRVIRGGSAELGADAARCAARASALPGATRADLGFRVLRRY